MLGTLYGGFIPSTALFNTYLRAKSHLTRDAASLIGLVEKAQEEGTHVSDKTMSLLIGFCVRTNGLEELRESRLMQGKDNRTLFDFFLRGLSSCVFHKRLRQGLSLFEHHPVEVRHASGIKQDRMRQYEALKNEFVVLGLQRSAWGMLQKLLTILEKEPTPLAFQTVCQLVTHSASNGHFLLNRSIDMMWEHERNGEVVNLDYGTAYSIIANTSSNRSIPKEKKKLVAEWVWEKMQPLDEKVPSPLFYGILNFHSQQGDVSRCFDVLNALDRLHPGKADPYQMQILSSVVSGVNLGVHHKEPERYKDCIRVVDENFDRLMERKEAGNITVSCVNILIAACGKAKELGRAFETFEILEDLGIAPDTHSYTLLMDICLTNRRYDAVFRLSEELEEKGLKYTSRTIEILVHSAMRVRDIYLIHDFLKIALSQGLLLTENLLQQVDRFLSKYVEKSEEEKYEVEDIGHIIESQVYREER